MVQIANRQLAGIPTLCLQNNQAEKVASKQPAVIILHGITNQKEDNLTYAYLLAKKGFNVFLPDALFHGERKFSATKNDQSFKFWNTVLKSIQELDDLKEVILKEYNVDSSRIYVGGISMGAITTFGALTQHDWIKGAFTMMGDPAFIDIARRIYDSLDDQAKSKIKPLEFYEEMLAPFDLSLQPHKLNGRSLFVWHGDSDVSVPIMNVQHLVEKVQKSGLPGDIVMEIESGRGHKVSNAGYHAMIEWLCLQENI